MESSISKEDIEFIRFVAKSAEPYPLDSKEAQIKYDDKRLLPGESAEKDRLLATSALKFLQEHGIPLEENT